MYNKNLNRFAIFTTASTFVLIFIGGLVTSTGSGLSVPDWPTTYGENMFTFPIDKWIGGIKYEHGHRLVASFIGFLTVILSVWLALREDRPWVKFLGFFALATVIIQGVLGGLTVLFLLPTAVSMAHGMLAQTFFCVVSSIALITSEWWRTGKRTSDYKFEKSMKTISVVAVAAVFLQLALGALLRHTYSGLSVPDFPLIHGQLFPALSTEAIAKYNQELISEGIRWSGDKPIESYQIVIHMFHRYWAYIVSGIVLFFGFRLKSSTGLPKRLQRIGLYLIIFVILQFTLGIITVLSRKEFIITSLHVVIGALILMICVIATLQIARINWLHQESQL
jgi:cytochrome c oxidase assembly protein subunit 15